MKEGTMLKTIGLTLAALVIALPAAAQTVCVTERGDVLKQLSSQFEENPVAMGLATDGSVVEVLAASSGSWTILVTKPTGVSCVVASGEAWDHVPPPLKGPKI
jgi:hypothetical protein